MGKVRLQFFLYVALWIIPIVVTVFQPTSLGLRIAVVLVSVLVAFLGFYSVIKPWKKWEYNRELILKVIIQERIETLGKQLFPANSSIKLRANVMAVRTPFLFWKTRFLEYVFQYNMEGDPDQDLKLNVDQGVAGEAYRYKALKYARLDEITPGYNLNAEQRDQTKHLRMIVSVPIWDIRYNHPGGKVIGVFNVDCKKDVGDTFFTDGTFKFLTHQANLIGLMGIF